MSDAVRAGPGKILPKLRVLITVSDEKEIWIPPEKTLSDVSTRNLKTRDKPYKVSDERGRFLLVALVGSKLSRFKYRLHGKEKSQSIGGYLDVSLARARSKRRDPRIGSDRKDPGSEEQTNSRIQAERQKHTLEAQALAFLMKNEKEGKANATMAKAKWPLSKATADFGKCCRNPSRLNSATRECLGDLVWTCLGFRAGIST